MLAALLGFFGVLVGAILTHLFSISNEWRIARARLEILVSDDKCLEQAVKHFSKCREEATEWVMDYLDEGEGFCFSKYKDREHAEWLRMRDARKVIVKRCRERSWRDARWRERLRLAFFNRPVSDSVEETHAGESS
jgi:hypothetical protein